MPKFFESKSPEETFEFAKEVGRSLKGGEIIAFHGNLGAGKTLFTKGLLEALEYDIDEVTSPSFALVNNYKARFDVFHIDLWRLEGSNNAIFAVGLEEILEDEDAVVIIEWAEKLSDWDPLRTMIVIEIEGSGDAPRRISVKTKNNTNRTKDI